MRKRLIWHLIIFASFWNIRGTNIVGTQFDLRDLVILETLPESYSRRRLGQNTLGHKTPNFCFLGRLLALLLPYLSRQGRNILFFHVWHQDHKLRTNLRVPRVVADHDDLLTH